jgi:hypothetical protein
MRIIIIFKKHIFWTLFFFCLILTPSIIFAQPKISFGLHADPAISWFSSDINEVRNNGARPGFIFGLTFNRYFSPNYSISTGISIINTGGKLITDRATDILLGKHEIKLTTVPAGKTVIYKIQYLSVPLGLKLQTKQIGYITFFSDIGLDPKVVIGGKADIPFLDIKGESALRELKTFNLSYHVTGGIEYSVGGNTALIFGLNFDNNFLDITRDNIGQPDDIISNKLLSFRIGVNF